MRRREAGPEVSRIDARDEWRDGFLFSKISRLIYTEEILIYILGAIKFSAPRHY